MNEQTASGIIGRNASPRSYDVIVAGGGTAGVCAAIAAARGGAKTLLIEQRGMLGGTMTMGLVTPLGASQTRSGKRFGGILWELLARVVEESRRLDGDGGDLYSSPQAMAYVLSRTVVGSGVSVLLNSSILETEREGDTVTALRIHNKSDLSRIHGKVFIDATGDGDLIAQTGEDFTLGSEPGVFQHLRDTGLDQVHEEDQAYRAYETSGLMQPVTLFFTMGGVDISRAETLNNRRLSYADLGMTRADFLQWPYANTPGFEPSEGEDVPLPAGRVLVTRTSRPGVAAVNMSRISGVDGTDAEALSRAEILAREQVYYLADFLRRFVPGFERASLHETAASLGVRETRRLVGRHVLTGTEAIRCVSFDDVVAQGSYMIDIHDPQGRRKAIGGQLQGDCYDIPWRSLLPKRVKNLLVCGRCISADHVAHSSTRIQGTCMLTGQAVGTAAALAVLHGIPPVDVAVGELQSKLKADGVEFHANQQGESRAGV
jgi:hypothetical protein